MQALLDYRPRQLRDGGKGAFPDDLAEDGRVLHKLLLLLGKSVQPRRDHALDRLRKRQVNVLLESPARALAAQIAAVDQHPDELLRVERVAARAGEQDGLRLCRQHRLLEERRDEPCRVVLGQGLQLDGGGVDLSSAPRRPALQQLGTRGGHDEDRQVAHPLDQVVDEIEQAVVGPLDVLEHKDERAALGQRLEEATPGGKRLAALVVAQLLVRAETDERLQPPDDPVRVHGIVERSANTQTELFRGHLRRVGFQDPGVRLDHLAQGPVRHSLAVRKRASLAPEDQVGNAFAGEEELVDQPRLADPGHADEGHQLRLLVGPHAGKGVYQEVELLLAAEQRRLQLLDDVDPESRPRLIRLPDPDRLGLSLRLDQAFVAEGDRPFGRPEGGLVHEDPVHRRCCLQARGRVHDIAGRHSLPRLGTCVERDERLAGGDPDPHLELSLLLGPLTDRERRANGPFCVVLVRDRRAEQGHDCVPDELLHCAAEALELRAQPLVVRPEDRLDVLGVERLGARGEADEVGEEDGHDLALAASRVHADAASIDSPCSMKRVAPTER